MASPRVTYVMVEYVHNGRRFSIQLDPKTVGAVFFGHTTFDRFAANVQATGEERPVLGQLLGSQFGVLAESVSETAAAASSETRPAESDGEPIAAESSDDGPALWWWMSGTWIHPADPPE